MGWSPKAGVGGRVKNKEGAKLSGRLGPGGPFCVQRGARSWPGLEGWLAEQTEFWSREVYEGTGKSSQFSPANVAPQTGTALFWCRKLFHNTFLKNQCLKNTYCLLDLIGTYLGTVISLYIRVVLDLSKQAPNS